MKQYSHIVRAVAETPWAILPAKLAVIVELVGMRMEGRELSDDEIRERIGAAQASRAPARSGAVAVLPLYGVIVPKATLMSEMSGGTSLSRFSAAFAQAVADADIGAILIDVDSPGGMVDLVTEVAEQIRGARGTKPITAIANTDAASAAYWLASQADELVVTPSGQVGSIGVFSAHEDLSGLEEKLGVKTTLVSAGKYKTEANPFEPLSDEARKQIQLRVDDYYGLFVGDVAKGRGVTPAAVRDGFGEGRMVTAKRALKLGMVDRIATFEDTVARLSRSAAARPRAAALNDTTMGSEHEPYAEHAERVLADVEAIVRRTHDRKDARGRAGRDLSAADVERLAELRQQLTAVASDLDVLLADASDDGEAATAAYARFLETETTLGLSI